MSFLFVDRIIDFVPGKTCRGLKHVTFDDTYLFKDENGELCFSPCIIGETLGQLAAWNVMFNNDFTMRPVAGVVESAQLHRNVKVGETLLLEATIDSADDEAVQYSAKAFVDGEEVFCITKAIGPMLPMENFIEQDLIKRQFEEICRPGEWTGSSDLSSDFLIAKDHTPRSKAALTYDRVIEHDPGVRVVGCKKISRQAPYFPDHFPNKPVLPMTILLECKINLAYQFIEKANMPIKYKLKELRKIKMNDFVLPGSEVVTSLIIKNQDANELILRFRSEVARKRVCVMEMVMTAVDKVC